MVSVDAQKKEQLGQLPAAGREWRPTGEPVRVEDHSFSAAGPDVPVAVRYGVYEVSADSGWVNVGVDHNTSAFAVASIRRWWQARGRQDYPNARRLLITADAGGSNSYRYRLWKAELATLAAETDLTITVCHFPPGTSKWNKIEHRLFSQVTMNWRGRPLTSHEVVVATIASTRTRTGLQVQAELDTGSYPVGIAVSREQLQALPIRAHAQHGAWNYTIAPGAGSPAAPIGAAERARDRVAALDLLADERLTGMSRGGLAALAADLAPAQQAQAAQRCFEQRGDPRRRAPGAGSRGLLSPADRVLVTVVYLRQVCSQNVLSDLLGINANSIGQAIAETRQRRHRWTTMDPWRAEDPTGEADGGSLCPPISSRLGTASVTVSSGFERQEPAVPDAVALSRAGSLRQPVRRAALWSASSAIFMRFANIAIMAVVARIVTPQQFGVFSLALTVHAVILSCAELGVASAVARSDLDADRIAPTVTTTSIATSLTLAALLAVFAQPVADLLGSSEAAAPLRVLALSVAMIGPIAVPGAQLQREFRQGRVFLATTVSFLPSSAVLILLAQNGDGAMAFAWSRVTGQLVAGLIMLAGLSRRYRPGFRRSEFGPLLRFGLPLAFANLLSQVLLNVDYGFVGRLLGTEKLGVYTLAFNVAAWPTAVIGSMLNGIIIPAFSRIKHDTAAVPGALYKAVRSVALVACPIGSLTLALAHPLIATVYGARWSAAAPVLQVLSFYGIVFVLCLLFANVIIAMGRTGMLLTVQMVALAILMPAIAVGIRLGGLVGVGVAHILVISSVTLPVYLMSIRRSTGVRASALFRSAAPPVFAGTVASLVAWQVSAGPQAPFLKLMAGGLSGTLIYIIVMAPLLQELLPPSLVCIRAVALLVNAVDHAMQRATHWAFAMNGTQNSPHRRRHTRAGDRE